ncbi:transglutaminase family protein [Aestuariivirga litoralis]|uniref:transglutaminase family protein n=1 Tax=Aestuariivirga litoralis TaxID=2650924 RepID=UPI0018C60B51|nr:transglutaminase family protein [Aestuariivirga litoralis]MBG1232611.1 transglutaminase family protein [Aestuariivirga litoralis]
MRLIVTHSTHYTYQSSVDYSVQRLLLTPLSFKGQKVESWRVTAPGIEGAMQYRDAFGNQVHLITAIKPKGSYSIVAEGVVDVQDMTGLVQGLSNMVPDYVYLRQVPNTKPSDAMLDMQAQFKTKPGDTLAFLHELMAAVHGAVAYETGTTDSLTTGAEAFAQGRGVCQDHAHIFIGLARASGIPTRYVTGYLIAEGTASASHAWAEAMVPNLGWVGFDAANDTCPTDHYIRVACGLDAAGTAPVRGSRRGGNIEQMTVEVRVEMAQQ